MPFKSEAVQHPFEGTCQPMLSSSNNNAALDLRAARTIENKDRNKREPKESATAREKDHKFGAFKPPMKGACTIYPTTADQSERIPTNYGRALTSHRYQCGIHGLRWCLQQTPFVQLDQTGMSSARQALAPKVIEVEYGGISGGHMNTFHRPLMPIVVGYRSVSK